MIALFKEITTEDKLQEIEAESEKWTGLYCDLEVAEERKFVKEKSTSIKDLLKKVNTARIAKTKDYRFSVEAEAKIITSRLEAANKPFTDLLEEYQVKRAAILAAKKASEEAEELRVELVRCHDEALSINELMTLQAKQRADEIAEAAATEAARIELEAQEREAKAAFNARLAEKERQKAEAAEIESQRLKVESDKAHVSSVRREIKEQLMSDCGIDEETAIKVVKSIMKIERITINYL